MIKHSKIATPSALLILLVAATPVFAIGSNRFGPALIVLIIATMLLLSLNAIESDARTTLAIFRPLLLLALAPAAWMAVQLLPVPLGTVEHPIWQSASVALQSLQFGHISVDLGYTLFSLAEYISLLALAVITCIIARDRDWAEKVLFALCAIAAFAAVELLLLRNSADLRAAAWDKPFPDNLTALVSLGTILNMAFVVRAVERYETKSGHRPLTLRTYVFTLMMGAAGVLLCSIALLISASNNVLITVVFGWTAFWLVTVLRRFHVGQWTRAAVCTAVVVVCCGIVALRFALAPPVSSLVRFAIVEQSDAVDATLRVLNETNWLGAGVGSYPALTALNRDAAGLPNLLPITTISAIVLEWGYVGTLVVVAAIAQLFIILCRGAFARGRDAFFSNSAAACVVTISCAAFCDASFTDFTVRTFATIIFGIGLSQSVGRQLKKYS